MSKLDDNGYKEVFSYPEFVQQLIDGFMPYEITNMMDFTTLKLRNELRKVLKTVSKTVAKAVADSDRIHKACLHLQKKIHAFHACR